MQESHLKILAAAQDTGGGNALVPVVRHVRESDGFHVTLLGTGLAARVFEEEEIDYRPVGLPQVADESFLQQADCLLKEAEPDLLLLGTAWGRSLEKALLDRAREGGIPSLAIVDTWSHFRERFLGFRDDSRLALPHRVAVADAWAYQQAVREGIPASCLVITGQPHLEAISQRVKHPAILEQARALRERWLSELKGELIVLFVSEPHAQLAGPGTPYYRGYTEFDALRGLLGAAREATMGWTQRIQIRIKLHPRESRETSPLAGFTTSIPIGWTDPAPALACLLAADAVVGMNSLLLMEASIAGRPTASYEPNAEEARRFYGAQIGAVAKITSAEELSAWLVKALSGAWSPAVTLDYSGATQRVMKEVFGLAAAWQRS